MPRAGEQPPRKSDSARQFEDSLHELEKAVSENPDDVRPRLKLADLHVKRGSFRRAAVEYRTVAERFAREGATLKSIGLYLQILKVDDNADDRATLGDLYRQLGMVRDAVSEYTTAAARADGAAIPEKSLAILRKIVELDPENILARERIAQIDSSDFENMRRLVEMLLERGNAKRALPMIQICFRAMPRDPETLALLARVFDALGKHEKAENCRKEIGRLEETHPEAPSTILLPPDESLAEGPLSPREMVDAFREGVDASIGRDNLNARFDLGFAYLEMGLLEEAIFEFKLALTSPALRGEAHSMIGLCHQRAGRLEEAVRSLIEATRTPDVGDRQRAAFFYELSVVHVERRDENSARAAFRQALTLDPESPREYPGKSRPHYKAAREAFAGGGSRDAFRSSREDDAEPVSRVADLERLLRAHPDETDARMNLAMLLVGENREADALGHFEIAADHYRKAENSTRFHACEAQIEKLRATRSIERPDSHCSFCDAVPSLRQPPATSREAIICFACIQDAHEVFSQL